MIVYVLVIVYGNKPIDATSYGIAVYESKKDAKKQANFMKHRTDVIDVCVFARKINQVEEE